MALRCKYCDGSGFGYDHHPDSPTEKVKCWHCSGTGMEEPPHNFVPDINTCAECGVNQAHHPKGDRVVLRDIFAGLHTINYHEAYNEIAWAKRLHEAEAKIRELVDQTYKNGYRDCELEFIPKSDRKEVE